MIRSARKPQFGWGERDEGGKMTPDLILIDSVCFQHLVMRQCSMETGKVDNLSLMDRSAG